MKIIFFFRRRQPSYNSIEEIFNTLIPIIGRIHNTSKLIVPYKASLVGVLMNWLYSLSGKADVVHITGDVHYLALFRKSPLVITVHDLQSIFRTNGIGYGLKKWLWLRGPLKSAQHIVAISENTRSEIVDMLPEVENKITVIPNPISPLFQFSHKTVVKNVPPLILHVGTAPHKNLEKVIQALSGLGVQLTVLGILSPAQLKLLTETDIKHENFSAIPYDRVYQLYLEADIISFPSDYEGFGMPIIEAQAVGRPLLTSNLSSIRTIAGKGALFVDVDLVENIKQGFLRLLESPELRATLIEEGKSNVVRYHAESVAKQYLEVYENVIDQG